MKEFRTGSERNNGCPTSVGESPQVRLRRTGAVALLHMPDESGDVFRQLNRKMSYLYPNTDKGRVESKFDVYDVGLTVLYALIYSDVSNLFMRDVVEGRALVAGSLPVNYVIEGRTRPYPDGTPYDKYMREMVHRISNSSLKVFSDIDDKTSPYFPFFQQLKQQYTETRGSWETLDHRPHDFYQPLVATPETLPRGITINVDAALEMMVLRQTAQDAPRRTEEEWLQVILNERDLLGRGDNLSRKSLNHIAPGLINTDVDKAMSEKPFAHVQSPFTERSNGVIWQRKKADGELVVLNALNSGRLRNIHRCSGATLVRLPDRESLEVRESIPMLLYHADAHGGLLNEHYRVDPFSSTDILMGVAPFIAYETGVFDYEHRYIQQLLKKGG